MCFYEVCKSLHSVFIYILHSISTYLRLGCNTHYLHQIYSVLGLSSSTSKKKSFLFKSISVPKLIRYILFITVHPLMLII